MQPSGSILSYLVEGYPRNILVKLFENWSIGLGVDIVQRFLLFLALEAILFIGVERFYLFWLGAKSAPFL